MKRIVILTLEYPFGNGENFLSNELSFYSKHNIEIILVPFKTEGTARSLPPGVSLFTEANGPTRWPKVFFEVLWYRWFWKEAMAFSFYFFFKSSRISFLFFLKAAVAQRSKLARAKSRNLIDPTDTALYSYWLGGLTGGAILFNRQFANSFKITSRAHGGDVYEYRYRPAYIPFREFVLKNVDRVATVSKDGAAYLRSKYPAFKEKIVCYYLGTDEPGFMCAPSADGIFRMVSCAHVNPVKRLHLIIEALNLFQSQHPEKRIHWTHLGGGPLLRQLVDFSTTLHKSVSCSFTGSQSPEQIMEFYKRNPVDVFVNTSASEGMPVSIMEAMSVGIPILATTVGGVEEMVDETCGSLLPADLLPQQLADAILDCTKAMEGGKRKEAAKKWAMSFYAEDNYRAFYQATIV